MKGILKCFKQILEGIFHIDIRYEENREYSYELTMGKVAQQEEEEMKTISWKSIYFIF